MINFFNNSTLLFSLSESEYRFFEHLDNQCCVFYLSDHNIFKTKILDHLDKCNFISYEGVKYGPYNYSAYGVRISSQEEEIEYKFALLREGEN